MLLGGRRSAWSAVGLYLLVASFRCWLLVESLDQRQQGVVCGPLCGWLEPLSAERAVAKVRAALSAHAVAAGGGDRRQIDRILPPAHRAGLAHSANHLRL